MTHNLTHHGLTIAVSPSIRGQSTAEGRVVADAPRTETAGPEPATRPQVRRLIVVMEAVTDMTHEEWTDYLRHVLAYDEITCLKVIGAIP